MINGTPEGRPGLWLIDADTACSLIDALLGDHVHNQLGTTILIGCDWEKGSAKEHCRLPGMRLAIIFPPNIHFGHQLIALSNNHRWGFDVGQIDESQMEAP